MKLLDTKALNLFSTFMLLVPFAATATEVKANSEVEVGAYLAYSVHHAGRAGDGDWGTQNNSSRWYLSGTLADRGLEAFGYYERGIAIDDGDSEPNREAFIGISSEFGTLTLGRQSTRYKRAGVAIDPFYDTTHGGSAAQLTGSGPSYGLSQLTDGSAPGTISYESPTYEGIMLSLAGYLDSGDTQDHDLGAGVSYVSDESGLRAGLNYLNLDGNVVPGMSDGGSAWRLYGQWQQGRWSGGGSVELLDREGLPDVERYFYLAGSYALRTDLRVAAAFGRTSHTPESGNALSIGGFYQLFDAFVVYASAHRLWLDEDHRMSVAVGASFSFDRTF